MIVSVLTTATVQWHLFRTESLCGPVAQELGCEDGSSTPSTTSNAAHGWHMDRAAPRPDPAMARPSHTFGSPKTREQGLHRPALFGFDDSEVLMGEVDAYPRPRVRRRSRA